MVLNEIIQYTGKKKIGLVNYIHKLGGIAKFLKPSKTGLVLGDGVYNGPIPIETLQDMLNTEGKKTEIVQFKTIKDPETIYRNIQESEKRKVNLEYHIRGVIKQVVGDMTEEEFQKELPALEKLATKHIQEMYPGMNITNFTISPISKKIGKV